MVYFPTRKDMFGTHLVGFIVGVVMRWYTGLWHPSTVLCLVELVMNYKRYLTTYLG